MASGRAIDHVVLTVRDLDRAAITYQELGFTLTPKAAHEDRIGTSNRLAQFGGKNFIELLEVDRPERLPGMTSRHRLGSSASAITIDWPCGNAKVSPCWSSQATTRGRTSAAFRPPISPPLHRSTRATRHATRRHASHRSVLPCLRAVPGHAEGRILRLRE